MYLECSVWTRVAIRNEMDWAGCSKFGFQASSRATRLHQFQFDWPPILNLGVCGGGPKTRLLGTLFFVGFCLYGLWHGPPKPYLDP